jgi:signal transduction histidine kinase
MTYKLERLARIDDSDNPSLQDVSITAVATESARQLREMADARNVTILVAEDMPSLVVDVGRLELTLVNLLSNAIKYCDPSKPACTVEISARGLEDGTCEICISDNGLGIPADRISQIFRRFTRVHTDREELAAVSGVGLGLSIVDDCVIAMNGTITVESTEGLGTMFCMTLPPTPAVATPAEAMPPGPVSTAGPH